MPGSSYHHVSYWEVSEHPLSTLCPPIIQPSRGYKPLATLDMAPKNPTTTSRRLAASRSGVPRNAQEYIRAYVLRTILPTTSISCLDARIYLLLAWFLQRQNPNQLGRQSINGPGNLGLKRTALLASRDAPPPFKDV